MELTALTIKEAHQALEDKEFSAKELLEQYWQKIEEKNKEIFAYLTVAREEALGQAERVDRQLAAGGELPFLAGIPLAVKDNILVQDVKCTAGSRVLENYIAPYDATVIKRLKEQGVVILGKTNLDEFAMGVSCEQSAFGPTKNPHDLERVPGGSSGGSAAAVAGEMTLAALGSDTGGSVRLPASFCGVVALKPTYGHVSRYGLIAMASSLDQIGPIAKTVGDCKIVFEAIKGEDEMDSTSVKLNSKLTAQNSNSQRKTQNLSNLKIGVPKEYFIEGMDEGVEKLVRGAIKKFETLGAKIEEISLPHSEYALACYYLVMPSEVSANLARYDGIRYGKSKTPMSNAPSKPKFKRPLRGVSDSQNLLDVYLETRKDYLGEEVKRRIMLGTFALSTGYYEAYYLRAQKVRTKIKEDFDKAFEGVDLILTPVSPTPAFKIGEKIEDPIKMYLADIFTVSVNLAGLPALSLPCGKIGHLPVGLQIIGNIFEEDRILEAAQIFEQA